ncbi:MULTISPECIES: anti-sigma factor family protein [Niastella]|uniref:Uncharacterized protein n=1 Tax=Niastella soli TaxID=2821487 RepID=A0ABS3YQ83_9BACT|nr:hypothetical protein [Niastella soli]MBO9200057.1 hypothetical protein [Niastella soli]
MSFNCYHIRTADYNSGSGGGQVTVITRDNYEAYLVMYVDEELKAAEREAVEQFIQQNPDLEEELVMLQQSVLQPDEGIVFEQKESLFRNTAVDGINESNCEEYFVLYGDDELTNEEKDKVEQFVYKHPQYQADFEFILQVKLVPDNSLSFPDKAYLFRSEEEDNRVIAFPWWRFTAAAIALLSIGSMVFYFSTHFVANRETAGVLPQTRSTEKTQQPAAGNNNTQSQADVVVVPPHEDNSVAAQPVHADQAVAKTSITKNISKQSNIQPPSYVQQVNTQQPEDVPAGYNEKFLSARSIAVVVTNQNEQPEVKSTAYKNTVSNSIASNTAYVPPIEEPDQSAITATVNKTPLRGFFRKVSRVVDKVTGPDENGKAGIRIANLEFALQ